MADLSANILNVDLPPDKTVHFESEDSGKATITTTLLSQRAETSPLWSRLCLESRLDVGWKGCCLAQWNNATCNSRAGLKTPVVRPSLGVCAAESLQDGMIQ